jgi:dihydrofolate reductase
MKHFKAIAAMSENRVIGNGNKIPWHIPEDFRWFKKMTTGHVVVMGRKTFESLGKPLPDRLNVILTRHPILVRKQFPEIFGASTLGTRARALKKGYQLNLSRMGTGTEVRLMRSVLKLDPEEYATDVFICGGAQIYEQTLPLCSDLFLTRVKRVVEGDAFFPHFEHLFERVAIITDTPEFAIEHWRRVGT